MSFRKLLSMSADEQRPGHQIFIVVAAYNEGNSIRQVIEQLSRHYSNLVVVDDGSADNTAAVLEHQPVFLLRHVINRGQGAALQTGIRFALDKDAEIIVTFDADGQHQVKDIPALLQPILSGEYDVSLGSRFLGRAYNMPVTRKWMLKAGIVFTRLVSGVPVTDVHNGLRAFSREAASRLKINIDRMAHASEILDQIKRLELRFKEVPVEIYYSPYSLSKGQSSWNAMRIAWQLLIEKATK